MSFASAEVVERARALVGAKFRPQGRDPVTGLDCVGVVLWAFGISAELVRRDYRLRGTHEPEVESTMCKWFRRSAEQHPSAGDVMLFAISPTQNHLAVNCGGTFVHADASLRRVVETPMPPRWDVAAIFRRRGPSNPD